jgi:hypothetical protein
MSLLLIKRSHAYFVSDSDGEVADYDPGFKAGSQGKEPDDTKSLAWQRGWLNLRSRSFKYSIVPAHCLWEYDPCTLESEACSPLFCLRCW